MTPMRTAIDEYLDLRRALGFRLKTDERLLGQFAGFMEHRRAVHITAKLAAEWAQQTPSTDQNYHAGRLRAVRSFARHRLHDDPMTEVPPTDMLPRRRNTFQPHIFTREEIQRILAASLHKWGGATPFYCLGRYTMYGLISVTGMRVSEVLNLDLGDVDLKAGVITIRNTKFGKSRLVPVHETTRIEPPRVCRRLLFLRDWSHDRQKATTKILTRGARARGSNGDGAWARTCFAMGGHRVDFGQDRMRASDPS